MSDFPQPVDVPADDQDSIIVDVLREYIRPGLVDSTIRTWVPLGIGSVVTWIGAHWDIVIPKHASSTFVVSSTATVTAVYYIGARLVERKWPRVGRILLALGLTKAKPVYAEPDTVKAVGGGDAVPVKTNPVTP